MPRQAWSESDRSPCPVLEKVVSSINVLVFTRISGEKITPSMLLAMFVGRWGGTGSYKEYLPANIVTPKIMNSSKGYVSTLVSIENSKLIFWLYMYRNTRCLNLLKWKLKKFLQTVTRISFKNAQRVYY